MTVIEKNQPRRCETQWHLKFNASLNTRLWPVIYKICNKIIQDNTIVWFQYKILYNILSTRRYSYKLKLLDSDLSGLCGESIETIYIY